MANTDKETLTKAGLVPLDANISEGARVGDAINYVVTTPEPKPAMDFNKFAQEHGGHVASIIKQLDEPSAQAKMSADQRDALTSLRNSKGKKGPEWFQKAHRLFGTMRTNGNFEKVMGSLRLNEKQMTSLKKTREFAAMPEPKFAEAKTDNKLAPSAPSMKGKKAPTHHMANKKILTIRAESPIGDAVLGLKTGGHTIVLPNGHVVRSFAHIKQQSADILANKDVNKPKQKPSHSLQLDHDLRGGPKMGMTFS